MRTLSRTPIDAEEWLDGDYNTQQETTVNKLQQYDQLQDHAV